MNEEESAAEIASSEPSALVEEVRLLRRYLVVTLLAAVVVTFCFNVFLYRLDRSTRGEIAQDAEFERTVGTSLSLFRSQVGAFAANHKDVARILSKYGLTAASTNALGSSSTNLPAMATHK